MSLRGWVVTRLESTTAVTNIVPAENIMTAGAVGVVGTSTEHPEPPFMLVRGSDLANRLNMAESQRFFIYGHDKQGSYKRIDEMLLAARQALLNNVPAVIGATRVSSVEWEGDSDDLIDDTLGTATKYGQFRVTGRQVG